MQAVEDFYRRHERALWPEQARLHVYLRANDALREVVRRYQRQLRNSGAAAVHGLGLQDPEFVHFTVQMLTLTRRQVPAEQLEKLTDRLRTDLRGIEPFTLRVGPPNASRHAVELWVDPGPDQQTDTAWSRLVDVVRQTVADVLGEAALPPLDSNATPHASLGYGIGTGDSGAINTALKALRPRPTMIEVPVAELELVAVTQHPAEGRFTWDTLARLPLGRA